jgi:hypothetical protein
MIRAQRVALRADEVHLTRLCGFKDGDEPTRWIEVTDAGADMAVSKVLGRVFRGIGWLLGLGLLALAAWLFSLEPSNDRDWQPDAAVLAGATIEGDMVTVHNLRNFDYRSEFDYTPAYYDKRYDLRKIEGVDLVAVYWMGPHIAHVFLSFAFSDGEHVAISIESRKEKGEAYSTFKGFFRQYELNYVVGDERDLIRLRSNYRRDPPEDVYVYRTAMPKEGAKQLFLEYMREINALKDKPVFYNTLTSNCTTSIWQLSRINPAHLPFSWKILASGHVPEYLHEHGAIGPADQPFADIQRRAHVNARAQAADQSADFSRLIRAELPQGAASAALP